MDPESIEALRSVGQSLPRALFTLGQACLGEEEKEVHK